MIKIPMLICAALLWVASPARAITAQLVSDATTIEAGQSITFNVVIFDAPPPIIFDDNGNVVKASNSGAFFFSGDGQQQVVISFLSFGPTRTGGNVTFTYLTPGDYVARVSGAVVYGIPSGGSSGGPPSFNFDAVENITVLPVAVPEPATWAMMLLGFAGLGFAFRHSARKRSTVALNAAI